MIYQYPRTSGKSPQLDCQDVLTAQQKGMCRIFCYCNGYAEVSFWVLGETNTELFAEGRVHLTQWLSKSRFRQRWKYICKKYIHSVYLVSVWATKVYKFVARVHLKIPPADFHSWYVPKENDHIWIPTRVSVLWECYTCMLTFLLSYIFFMLLLRKEKNKKM